MKVDFSLVGFYLFMGGLVLLMVVIVLGMGQMVIHENTYKEDLMAVVDREDIVAAYPFQGACYVDMGYDTVRMGYRENFFLNHFDEFEVLRRTSMVNETWFIKGIKNE